MNVCFGQGIVAEALYGWPVQLIPWFYSDVSHHYEVLWDEEDLKK